MNFESKHINVKLQLNNSNIRRCKTKLNTQTMVKKSMQAVESSEGYQH